MPGKTSLTASRSASSPHSRTARATPTNRTPGRAHLPPRPRRVSWKRAPVRVMTPERVTEMAAPSATDLNLWKRWATCPISWWPSLLSWDGFCRWFPAKSCRVVFFGLLFPRITSFLESFFWLCLCANVAPPGDRHSGFLVNNSESPPPQAALTMPDRDIHLLVGSVEGS